MICEFSPAKIGVSFELHALDNTILALSRARYFSSRWGAFSWATEQLARQGSTYKMQPIALTLLTVLTECKVAMQWISISQFLLPPTLLACVLRQVCGCCRLCALIVGIVRFRVRRKVRAEAGGGGQADLFQHGAAVAAATVADAFSSIQAGVVGFVQISIWCILLLPASGS